MVGYEGFYVRRTRREKSFFEPQYCPYVHQCGDIKRVGQDYKGEKVFEMLDRNRAIPEGMRIYIYYMGLTFIAFLVGCI